MKKISLLVVLASIGLALHTANAQTPDTTKNKVEIKKKTKVGVNGRQVTKIKMESKGTPSAMTGAVESATGNMPQKAAAPAKPTNPTVVVLKPEPTTKVVTTSVAVKPVTTTKTTTTTINTRHVTASKVVPRKTKKP